MSLLAFPSRYRNQRGVLPPISPGILSPMDNDSDAAWNPSALEATQQNPNPSGPSQDPIEPLGIDDTDQQRQIDSQKVDLPTEKTGYRGLRALAKEDRSARMPPPGGSSTNAEVGASNVALPPLNGSPTVIPGALGAAEAFRDHPEAVQPESQAIPQGAFAASPATSQNTQALPAGALVPGATSPATATAAAPEVDDDQLKRPKAAPNNWAQRLGLAVLSMTKFGPIANQIIHPKWSEQEGAYERQQADLSKQADIAQKQGKAEQEQATAAKMLNQAKNGDRKFKVVGHNLLNTETGETTPLNPTVQELYTEAIGIGASPDQALVHALGGKVEMTKPEHGIVAVTPELATQLADFGLKPGDQLPAATMDKYLDILKTRQKDPNAKIPKGDELEWIASNPDEDPARRKIAQDALALKAHQALASRPVTNNNLTIPGVNLGPSTLKGEDYLATLPPAFAARVKQVALGNEKLPTGQAANRGVGAQLANAVYQYDPEYTPLLGDMRHGTLSEFNNSSNSKAGGQVLALNTLVHHADLYLQAADALKNGSFKPGNAAYNSIATMMGSAPPNNAALIARFLAGETGKVATGGVPAEGEINGILRSLGTDASPDQIHGAGQSLLAIAAGRMIPLNEKLKNAKLEKFHQVLGPDAKDILTRRGYDPNTLQPAAGNYVRTAKGQNGHTIGQKTDGAWYDIQTGAKIQ